MSDNKIKIYERALAREKAARKEAERILEEKSKELYLKSEELRVSNKKFENLWRETSSELQGVFENIVDSYAVINLDGSVIKMNESAKNLLGFKQSTDFNLMKLVHPKEVGKVISAFKRLLKNGSITNFEVSIVVADNTRKLIHINASIIYDSSNTPIAAQGIVRDVTKEKAAEQFLLDSQNRLSTLIQNLDIAVLLEDENRNIVIANSRFCEFFKIPYTPESLIGQNCEQAAEMSKNHFKDPPSFVSRIDELLKLKQEAFGDELNMVDGRILERDFIPIQEEGKYKGHLWTYRDVTLKRKFREGLELQKTKYSNVIDNMNLGLIEVNIEDKITFANKTFEMMSGYTEAELLGKNGQDLLIVEDYMALIDDEKEKLSQGQSNAFEIKAITKSGEIKHWLVSAAPNYDIQGNMIGSIGINLDITHLKKLEIQTENLVKKLEKSNDELQEYAHVVSHDLKSPLRSINALVSWIKDDDKNSLSEDAQNNLKLIDETLEKMEHLISDVLEYSSVSTFEAPNASVNVNAVINDIKKLVHFPINMELQIPQPLPTVKGNRIRIQQLFLNLISNSIKYSDKEKGIIVITATESPEEYEFAVRDNGMGIAKEYHEKIFKIFQSLNNHKDSTGIGLSIVKKIVELHKGTIWVESIPGEGATFFFTIQK